jgi:FMR1-interacting protein 1 (NUFIP1)
MYNQGKGTGPVSWQSYYSLEAHNQRLPPTSIGQPSTPYSVPLRFPTFLPPLVNPYAPEQFSNLPTNAQGYTLSSSYVPTSVSEYQSQPRATPGRGFAPSFGGGGNIPCKRQGCSYMGRSNKEIELHMMDRHFIYPPRWNERKRKRDDGGGPDGDASTYILSTRLLCTGFPPSLTYSTPVYSSILIQQYRIQLDTPETIQKWIADRKKKWPSSKRVEEKARSTEEARARGELFFPAERTHRDRTLGRGGSRGRGRGRGASSGRGRGRGRGRDRGMQLPIVHPDDDEDREAQGPHSPRGRAVDSGWGTRGRGTLPARPVNSSHLSESSTSSEESDSNRSPSEDGDSVSDSASDMDPVKDAVSSRPPPDPNAEAKLSPSRLFIQRSMVDDENDEDAMAVDKALGLPSPESKAEIEAGADLDVGSGDILDSTAVCPR